MNIQISSTTVSEANQTAVPSLVRAKLDLKPGDKLLWEISNNEQVVKLKPSPRLWGKHMRGLGKTVWTKTDSKKYLNKFRQDRNF